jgi:hypothetical protein
MLIIPNFSSGQSHHDTFSDENIFEIASIKHNLFVSN